jgi:hypothetical protein
VAFDIAFHEVQPSPADVSEVDQTTVSLIASHHF